MMCSLTHLILILPYKMCGMIPDFEMKELRATGS